MVWANPRLPGKPEALPGVDSTDLFAQARISPIVCWRKPRLGPIIIVPGSAKYSLMYEIWRVESIVKAFLSPVRCALGIDPVGEIGRRPSEMIERAVSKDVNQDRGNRRNWKNSFHAGEQLSERKSVRILIRIVARKCLLWFSKSNHWHSCSRLRQTQTQNCHPTLSRQSHPQVGKRNFRAM